MNIHFGNPGLVQTIASAIPLYGSKEFESPTRSTIPMLALLMDASGTFAQILKEIGVSGEYDLFLEYKVRPPQGRGMASHTDVMIKSSNKALGIEGKWTEPMYDTVEKWLTKGRDKENRQKVRDGWIKLVEPMKTLNPDQFGGVIYQMLHRAASVASMTTCKERAMAYFVFKTNTPKVRCQTTAGKICGELLRLWNVLGSPPEFPFYVVEIETNFMPAYEPLVNLPKDEDTSEAVCAALQDASKPLFAFKHQVRQVGVEPPEN